MKTMSRKKKRAYTISPEARARLGRKPVYPAARELAQRCKISLNHAMQVYRGRRVGAPVVMEILAEINAREAAGK